MDIQSFPIKVRYQWQGVPNSEVRDQVRAKADEMSKNNTQYGGWNVESWQPNTVILRHFLDEASAQEWITYLQTNFGSAITSADIVLA